MESSQGVTTKTREPKGLKTKITKAGKRKQQSAEPLSVGGMTKTNRNQLIEEYRGYVEQIVGRLMQTMHLPPDLRPEFIAAGYLGLVEAAERFDAAKGVDFKSYAFLRVRGEIIDAVRKNCNISGRGYRMLQALEASNDMGLENVEARKGKGKTKEQKVGHLIDYLAVSAVSYRLTELGRGHSYKEQVDHDTPEEHAVRRSDSEQLRRFLDQLPDQERTIIEKYYFAGKRFIEIAQEEEGTSKSWISRLHARALKKLKELYEQEAQND